MTPVRVLNATQVLVAALLTLPAHASDCYRIQDPDLSLLVRMCTALDVHS